MTNRVLGAVFTIACLCSCTPEPKPETETGQSGANILGGGAGCPPLLACADDSHCQSGVCYRPFIGDIQSKKGVCVEWCTTTNTCGKGTSCKVDLSTMPDTSYVCAPTSHCIGAADVCAGLVSCTATNQCISAGYDECYKEATATGLKPKGVCVDFASQGPCRPQYKVIQLPGSAPDVAYVCAPPDECPDQTNWFNLPLKPIDPLKNLHHVIPSLIPGSVCGDDLVTGSEQCDGINLNGETCWTLTKLLGYLTCNADCTINTSKCTIPEHKVLDDPIPHP
jgi:hypothetical protein